MSPLNDGYGVVWAILCPEKNAGAIFGAKDFRDARSVEALTGSQRIEETAFIAEVMYRSRRFRCPAVQVSPEEFTASINTGNILLTAYSEHQLLPKRWFLQANSKRKQNVH
jgi:hypothetical protein